MTVLVEDVRYFLKNLPEDFVSDETISQQIDLAEWVVSKEKSASATAADVDMVVKVRSAYYVTLAYMEESERALGVIPPGLGALVNELKNELANAMQYIQRGAVFSVPLAVASISESFWDYRAQTSIKTEVVTM